MSGFCAVAWSTDNKGQVMFVSGLGRMMIISMLLLCCCQAEDGMRGLVRSRGLGDVYKRQAMRT